MTLAVGPAAVAGRHIEALISERGLGPGDRLPTERELATDAGVSRAVIRTVLDDLASRGVVRRHVGRGTFLAPMESVAPVGTASHPSPNEIMISRLVLEPELMPLAVAAATQADIDEMRRCLRAGDRARSSDDFERWDTALHHSFALATHNVVLVGVSQLLIDCREQPIWGGLKRRTFTADLHREYCTEHENIVEAIADRDPDAARAAMRAHLRHVRTTLLGEHA